MFKSFYLAITYTLMISTPYPNFNSSSYILRLGDLWFQRQFSAPSSITLGSLSDRGTSRHYLDCSCTFGHFSWIVSTTSFFIEPVSVENFVFIHWRSLCKAGLWTVIVVPFGLEASDIRKPAKCVSPHREANKIIYVFVPLLYCLAI